MSKKQTGGEKRENETGEEGWKTCKEDKKVKK